MKNELKQILKLLTILGVLFFTHEAKVLGQVSVKAWIEIEGEIHDLSLKAKLENSGEKALPLNYVLKVKKEGRSGDSNTIQKGSFIALSHKICCLSESRMNLKKDDELIASLFIYHDSLLVAKDSVVFHRYNY
ncbi:hypothetical protein [Labilibaculum sp.]|uniref:hypothetical protein n=1 Tax=Labilibaculum sp. TaxID=2060723 RepID=UPI003561DD3A